jgi:hypothetical protein
LLRLLEQYRKRVLPITTFQTLDDSHFSLPGFLFPFQDLLNMPRLAFTGSVFLCAKIKTKLLFLQGVLAHACNPSTKEAKFKARLGYLVRLCYKTQKLLSWGWSIAGV